MFGAKARKIKRLEADYALRVQESSKFQAELLRLREANVGLTADRDSARASVEALNSDRKELRAERDQFAKRVEELEREKAEWQKGHGGEVIELNAGRIQPGDEPERDISQGDLDGVAG